MDSETNEFTEEAGIDVGQVFKGVMETITATEAGLECRPLSVTLEDSWVWLAGLDAEPPRSYRPAALDRDNEARILAAYAARS